MASLKIILMSLLLFLTAVLSVQNAAPASLRFFAWKSITMPVGVMLTLCFCIGLLLSIVIFPVRSRR